MQARNFQNDTRLALGHATVTVGPGAFDKQRRARALRVWCALCEVRIAAARMDYCPVCALEIA